LTQQRFVDTIQKEIKMSYARDRQIDLGIFGIDFVDGVESANKSISEDLPGMYLAVIVREAIAKPVRKHRNLPYGWQKGLRPYSSPDSIPWP
jgi:hypothetical protein